MARQSKIEELGLQQQVLDLKSSGTSPENIAKQISNESGTKISNMAVRRFIVSYNESYAKGLIEKANDSSDIVNPIMNEFKIRFKEINDNISIIMNKAVETEDFKLMLSANDQLRKNYIALVRTMEERIKPIANIQIKKETNVLNFYKDAGPFCPTCSAKINKSAKRYLDESDIIDV